MEPLLDKLGRQKVVRSIFDAIRTCDKQSDKLARNKRARRIIAGVVKFVFSMLVMTIICEWAWGTYVTGKIYCDSDGDFGYLTPGCWVSDPIAVVHQIPAVRQYGDPDVIIEGWSISKLWCLWFSFFGISLVISILFAWVQWIPLVQRTFNTATDSNCSNTKL